MIELLENEHGAYHVRAKFGQGAHAGQEVTIFADMQKLSILQAGIVQLDSSELESLGIELPTLMMPRDEFRQIGPAIFDNGTDDPAILNAALEMWDALNEPGSSRRDWYTGEPLSEVNNVGDTGLMPGIQSSGSS